MKRLPIVFFFLLCAFFSSANNNSMRCVNKPIDSTFFKNRGIYVDLSPFTLSSSFSTNTKEHSFIFSNRVGVNWMTKKYRKFKAFGAKGIAVRLFDQTMTTNELGFMVGKLFKDKNSGFWDLNVGLSYFGTKTKTNVYVGSFWDGGGTSVVRVDQVHSYGIPFEATFFGSRLPVGVGVGITGNLNVEQPYIGFSFSMRFGNPVV